MTEPGGWDLMYYTGLVFLGSGILGRSYTAISGLIFMGFAFYYGR